VGTQSSVKSQLRKALGDTDVIETVPKKGYRFLGTVRTAEASPQTTPPNPMPVEATAKPTSGDGIRKKEQSWIWAAFVVLLVAAGTFYF
jgi:DNA-binding winged helix-turn-helix (wHTH) protein